MALELTPSSAAEFLTNAYTFRDSGARQAFFKCVQTDTLTNCFGSGAPVAVDKKHLATLGAGGSLVMGVGVGLAVAWAVRALR